jgi:plastocyanin
MNRIWRAVLALPLELSACGSYTAPTGPQNMMPPAAQANDIRIVVGASQLTTTAFNPNPQVVSLGSSSSVTLRWVNGDVTGGDYYHPGIAVVHSIVSDNGAFAPSGALSGNATYSVTLTATGNYPYHCGIHPGMVGTVTVNP